MHYDSVMPSEEDSADPGLLEQHLRKSSHKARPKSSPAGVPPTRSPTQKPSGSNGPPQAASPAASHANGSGRPGQQAPPAPAGSPQNSPTRAGQPASSSPHADSRDQGHFATSSPRSAQTSPRKQTEILLNRPTANGSPVASASSTPAASLSSSQPRASTLDTSAPDNIRGTTGQTSVGTAQRSDLPLLMDFGESDRPDVAQPSTSTASDSHAGPSMPLPPAKPPASLLDADLQVSLANCAMAAPHVIAYAGNYGKSEVF